MNMILKQFLTMSCSGAVLILALFLGKGLWKNKISRQWQYYVWLIVIMRLLLPFGMGINLMGKTYLAIEQAAMLQSQETSPPQKHSADGMQDNAIADDWGSEETQEMTVRKTAERQMDKPQMAEQKMTEQETSDSPEALTTAHPFRDTILLLASHIWLVWLVVALGMLIRKITVYQSFVQYINAGSTPVSDMEVLNLLSVTAEQLGIKKPVELCTNPQIASPLLKGFFHPCIVLPSVTLQSATFQGATSQSAILRSATSQGATLQNVPIQNEGFQSTILPDKTSQGADISEKNIRYIMVHELIHYKRKDMFYKWLVQITVCLHWFNPFVHLMSREITRACEFSCDEAVLVKTGCMSPEDYGKTLLDAMAAVGKYKESLGAVTLSENKKILKERLKAIMNYERKSKTVRILTGALTLCIIFGASALGVYPVAAAPAVSAASGRMSGKLLMLGLETTGGEDILSLQGRTQTHTGTSSKRSISSQAEQYYEADSPSLFQIAFSRLKEKEQLAWLEKLYDDGDAAFFSVAVSVLDGDAPLLAGFAEKAYADRETALFSITVDALDGNDSLLADFAERAYTEEETALFSILTDCMDETELELWLDRALEDDRWSFQAILFDELDMEDEKDAQEEKWEEQLMAEYEAVGVTKNGKNYYYQGQLLNIFLDIRPNQSFYTLNTNPAGTVNIKIIRREDGKITGVSYMDETEATELLGDMAEPDDF